MWRESWTNRNQGKGIKDVGDGWEIQYQFRYENSGSQLPMIGSENLDFQFNENAQMLRAERRSKPLFNGFSRWDMYCQMLWSNLTRSTSRESAARLRSSLASSYVHATQSRFLEQAVDIPVNGGGLNSDKELVMRISNPSWLLQIRQSAHLFS